MIIKKNKLFATSFLFMLVIICVGQKVLTLEDYVKNIKEYHPYIKITNNKLLKADLKLKAAAGAFDPKIVADWDIKNFKEKTYYDQRSAKLKSSTRLGVSPIVKYQNNAGYYLNPENGNPSSGLIGAGLEIPLIRGLVIDDARKDFRVAKLAKQEQIFSNDSIINIIISDALISYVDWVTSYVKLQAVDNLLKIRIDRYSNILELFQGGSLPAMDTLDAFSQLQKTRNEYLYTKTNYIKSYYKLLNQIWDESLDFKNDSIVPESPDAIIVKLMPNNNNFDITQHNFIKSIEYRKLQQEVHLKYQKEQFKPKLNIELLPITSINDGVYGFNTSNFISNINVEIPLFYRKQANYSRIAKLELENISYQTQLLERKINNQYLTLVSNNILFKEQYILSSSNISYLNTLRNLENEKYLLGESDLIKLNYRENKLIDEQIKFVDSIEKYCKNLIELNQLLQLF